MAQKNMTIETLAEMINEGFKSTATKEDVTRVEVRMDGADEKTRRRPRCLVLHIPKT